MTAGVFVGFALFGSVYLLPAYLGQVQRFMAILNIQITNASLLDIEGGIGTGVDNGSWISTSYLIGEIVVIPLTEAEFPFGHYPVPAGRSRQGQIFISGVRSV